MLSMDHVAILYTEEKTYPYPDSAFWFRPPNKYPDVTYKETGRNTVYASVRELLHLYHMDDYHYGTSLWNPLGEIIKPGDYVLIKPNLVMDCNQNREADTDCLYTQPSVVVPIIDYVIKALGGKGKIVIGDAPMQECDFDRLIVQSGYKEIIDYYARKGAQIELLDFRGLVTEKVGIVRYQSIRDGVRGTVIDLGDDSCFSILNKRALNNLRITNYSPDRLQEHHRSGKHEYYISNYALEADVIVNIPKPKTHRKAGFTAAMKNMVGVNVRKEYLPHHTIGSKEEGGDEYLRNSWVRKLADKLFDEKNMLEGEGKYNLATIVMLFAGGIRILSNTIYSDEGEGSWYGNETISKTIVDLNKIILYADKKGVIQSGIQRRILNIGDMIIAGEKEGPVRPSPRRLGVLVIGTNNFAFDVAVGTMMGANVARISQISEARKTLEKPYSIASSKITIRSNNGMIDGKNPEEVEDLYKWRFEPPDGWKDVFF